MTKIEELKNELTKILNDYQVYRDDCTGKIREQLLSYEGRNSKVVFNGFEFCISDATIENAKAIVNAIEEEAKQKIRDDFNDAEMKTAINRNKYNKDRPYPDW